MAPNPYCIVIRYMVLVVYLFVPSSYHLITLNLIIFFMMIENLVEHNENLLDPRKQQGNKLELL